MSFIPRAVRPPRERRGLTAISLYISLKGSVATSSFKCMSPMGLKEKLRGLPIERQEKVRARTQELIAEEATLKELRKSLELTQETVGKKLNINQEAISRIENRSDLLLSTLRSYICAMGGELSLTVDLPNRKPLKSKGFSGIKNCN